MLAEPRAALRSLVDAALAAVAPDEAVLSHLRLHGSRLEVFDGERRVAAYDLDAVRRVLVLGAGKGAAPMAEALERLLGERIADGLVIVKYGHGLPLSRIRLREGGHPVPDQGGEEGAHELVRLAHEARADDLVLCVFTGGASALTPALAPALTPALAEALCLADLQKVTSGLLGSGATIHEMNAVRKHLSALSGGNLARAAFPAQVLGLIVSDVVGDELDVIASGPTVPDPTTFCDALGVIEKYGLSGSLPEAVLRRLKEGAAGRLAETPKSGDPAFANVRNVLVADNRQALDAAVKEALRLGFAPRVLTSAMQGEAREVGRALVEEALRLQSELPRDAAPLCLLAGGETTVTLRGAGRGGRNQEMALAALLALEHAQGIHMVCVGTDGTDGPTDAAGGFASAGELKEIAASPLFAGETMSDGPDGTGVVRAALTALDENDSNAFLECAGCLLRTGPTRTNVMDVAILLVEPLAV